MTILKSKDRDDTNPSSYRPLCLLPVLSKLLEKLVKTRLEPLTSHMYTHQYGFIKSKSTLDVVVKLKTIFSESRDKYVIGIFVDIKGVFDRVWWPDILSRLRHIRCPSNLYKLIASYLSNRKVTIMDHTVQITRQQNRYLAQHF